MNDELRPNETPRPGETVNREYDKSESVSLPDELKRLREKVNDYVRKETLDSELQGKLKTLNKLNPNVRTQHFCNACCNVLSGLSEKAMKALIGGTPTTEKDKNFFADMIQRIDIVLTFISKPKCRVELLFRKAEIQRYLDVEKSWSTSGSTNVLFPAVEEKLDIWMNEYRNFIVEHPEEEWNLKLISELNRVVQWRLCSKHVDKKLSSYSYQTDCRIVFGKKYAKFDHAKKALASRRATPNRACELYHFLNNPPEPLVAGGAEKDWALAKLCHNLAEGRTDYYVFGGLERHLDFIFDPRYFRNLRDRHICNALFLEASLLLQLRDVIAEEEPSLTNRRLLTESMREEMLFSLNCRIPHGLALFFKDLRLHRTNIFENFEALRNTALYFCWFALSNVIEKPIERITAAVGTMCLNHDEFNNALEGNISFKAMLLKAYRRGKMRECARALALFAAHIPFAERLLAETDWTGVEYLKTWFYDCLDDLGGGRGIPCSQRLSAAGRVFFTIVADFARLEVKGNVSESVSEFLDLIEKYSSTEWFNGERETIDKLTEYCRPLQYLGATKFFEGKYQCIVEFLSNLDRIVWTIRGLPTVVSECCFRGILEKLAKSLVFSFEYLCKTTKPQLFLGDAQSIEVRREDESKFVVRVPITSVSDESSQNALNVRLRIRGGVVNDEKRRGRDENKRDSEFVVVKEAPIIGVLPCGGRTEMMEFTLKIREPLDLLTAQFQLEYEYYDGLTLISPFETKGITRMKRMTATGKTVLPSEDEWFSYDIVIPGGKSAKKKHELNKDRLNAFDRNNGIHFDSPGVKQILDNRNEQVNQAINALTKEGETDAGIKFRRFLSSGRLVLIYGQWRVGKTVILDLIDEKLQHDYPNAATLYFSFQGVEECEDFESYLTRSILRDIRNLFRNKKTIEKIYQEELDYHHIDLWSGGGVDWFSFTRFLKSFIARLREEANIAFILLGDEFTGVYPKMLKGFVKADFLTRWTQMITTTNLLCVVAGGEHTSEMFETYDPNAGQKVNERISVGYLSPPDVENYVRYVLYEVPEDGVPLEESYFSRETEKAAFDRIFELTRGNPFLLWHLCGWLIDWLKESEVPFLTKTAVNDAIDFKLRKETNLVSFERSLFDSLYNPFNEKTADNDKDEVVPIVTRLKDDRVRDDNKTILDAIVELANPVSHRCGYDELYEQCRKKGMDEKTFKSRLDSLDKRTVVIYLDGAVRIFVDLYYEIKTRIERKRKNDLL